MKKPPLYIAARLLPIAVLLVVLACDVLPDDPTQVHVPEESSGGDQSATQPESMKRVDQPTLVGTPTVEARGTQAVTPPTPKPPVATGSPQRSPVPPQVVAMPLQVTYVTANNLDETPDGSSDELAKLVSNSTLIAIGTTSGAEPREERIPGRLPGDPSKPDPNFTMIGNIYDVQVERYLKGDDVKVLSVIQPIGFDAIVPGPGNTPGRLSQGRDGSPNVRLGRNSRYLLFLEENEHAPGLWKGTAEPYRFLLEEATAKVESPVGTLEGAFPDRGENELVSVVESLISGKSGAETPKIEAAEIPNGIKWVLETVDGSPLLDDTFASLTVRGDWYGGFDGCNSFGGRTEDGTPIARADGTFTAPAGASTAMLCEQPAGLMEQTSSYVRALWRGETYRLGGDQLEILDGTGATRLVLVRQEPLLGRPVDLVGTAWQLVAEDDEDRDARAPTLAFLTEHIVAGVTACRGYVAEYKLSDGRIRFPSLGMTGSAESCAVELLLIEGDYTDHFTWADEYTVEESVGESLLRIRARRGETFLYESLSPVADDIFDSRWTLTTFVEPHKTESGDVFYSRSTDVIPKTEVTIEFSEEGVSGSAGCNSYGAPLKIEGSTIAIGAATVTRAWCDDPERLMDQERRFLDIMSRVSGFRIYGDRRAFLTEDGDALLFRTE